MMVRHFLTLADLNVTEIEALIHRAIRLKEASRRRELPHTCSGRVLAMIFEKSSTRTRVSFETAMAHLGGHAVFLSSQDSQLGRGEPIEDTARVLSKLVDGVMIRTFEHARITRFAEYSSVPVINGLSDSYHPCQLLADLQTYHELKGTIRGKKVAWFGDGNNMCNSWINAAGIMDFQLHVAGPAEYRPHPEIVRQGGANITLTRDPQQAAAQADLVVTDTWTSMGQEDGRETRRALFKPYQVNEALMELAAADALFMHCLPAYRGAEVSTGVIDGSRSVVWEEAGNRLHAQKALLEFLLGADEGQ